MQLVRLGRIWKLSQNSSIIAAIMRISTVWPGKFSSRLMVGCEQSGPALSGGRPTDILKAGSTHSTSLSLPFG